MATSYKDFQLSGVPLWLRDAKGLDAYHLALGDAKDGLLERMKASIALRLPLRAPTDALDEIGVERGIPRGDSEADASYAARLQGAWDTWPYAGTAQGVLAALKLAGLTAALVQQTKYGYTLDGSGNVVITTLGGTGWQADTALTKWNRFTVIILPPFPLSWLSASAPVIAWLTSAGVTTAPVSSSTPMTQDLRIMLWVTTAGLVASTARVKYSLDNGDTFSAAMTFAAAATALASYVTLTVAGGATSVTLDSIGLITQAFNVPADGSSFAGYVKSLVNAWKPAHSAVARYVLPAAGPILGWPVRALGSTTPGGAPRRLGGSLVTYWSP